MKKIIIEEPTGTMTGFKFEKYGSAKILLHSLDLASIIQKLQNLQPDKEYQNVINCLKERLHETDIEIEFKAVIGAYEVAFIPKPEKLIEKS